MYCCTKNAICRDQICVPDFKESGKTVILETGYIILIVVLIVVAFFVGGIIYRKCKKRA